MAKATPNDATKTFSENTVAVLLMALGNVSISKAQYNLMSALDGKRTPSSFEHQFRAVVKQARELKARVDSGENFTPAVATNKRSAAAALGNTAMETPPATPKKAETTKAAAGAARTTKGKKATQQPPSPDGSTSSNEGYVRMEAPASDDGEDI